MNGLALEQGLYVGKTVGSAPGILFYLRILGQAAKRLCLEVGWWLHFFIIFFQLQSFGKKAL